MIKLKTGVSTSLDFVKAMKERGQDVSPAFPAETLRDQLDALSEEVKVTFNSDNETILQVVNDFEPGPVPPTPTEKVLLTIVPDDDANIESSVSLEIEVDKDSTFDLEAWYTENEDSIHAPEGMSSHYFTSIKGNETLKTSTVVMDSNKTMYLDFMPDTTMFDWDGEHPEEVGSLIFKDTQTFAADDQTYSEFIASLENNTHDDAPMFDVFTASQLRFNASWNDGSPILSLSWVDSTYGGTVATWNMTSPRTFTLQPGSEPYIDMADSSHGITYIYDSGTVANMGYVALNLLKASIDPHE